MLEVMLEGSWGPLEGSSGGVNLVRNNINAKNLQETSFGNWFPASFWLILAGVLWRGTCG